MRVRNYEETRCTAEQQTMVRKFIAKRLNLDNPGQWARFASDDLPVLLANIPISETPFPVIEAIVAGCREK